MISHYFVNLGRDTSLNQEPINASQDNLRAIKGFDYDMAAADYFNKASLSA